jgi:hypothetical protein
MKLSPRARLGTAALLVSALGLVGPGYAAADAAPAAHSGAPSARAAATPKLVFAISKTGAIKQTRGPKTLRPGRVAYSVTSKRPGATLGFVRFAKGYTFRDFRGDLKASFGPKGNMKALKRAIAHSTFLGGAGAVTGKASTGTVVLPRAGKYTVYNFGGNLPKSPRTITVRGKRQARPAPKIDATVKAINGAQFGGASTMPHKGTLRFVNASNDSPHFLSMIQVQPGTTAQDILDYFQSGSQEPPSFYIADGPSTEVVGPHQSMTMNYNAPAGTYAEMCFFPDPNMGGMPHAMMGMIRIVTLN